MRPRSGSHLVLLALAVLWVAAVAHSLRYRDLVWLRVLFVDVTWLQALVLAVGGFGALMVLAGALSPRPRRPAPPAHLPFVSVVVPAKNEEAVIEATVRSLCALDYAEGGRRRFEVIVVDDRSTDATGAILDRLASELPVRVVRTPDGSFGKAGAMNFGISRARGEVIVVFDADARVAPDFLRRMVSHLDGENVGGVQSRRLIYNAAHNLLTRIQDDEYRLFAHLAQRGRQALGGMVSFSGNGMLFTRVALENVGGVSEHALIENVDLSLRLYLAGWKIRYCEDAVVWEEGVPRLRDFLRQRVRWFMGGLQCLGEYLPQILFSQLPLIRRIDILLFLTGAVLATLALLTTYGLILVDLTGMLVLYLQIPRRVTTVVSAFITVSVLLAVLVEKRWRPWEVATAVARLACLSFLPHVAIPLAIYRYIRSAVTGQTTWEKTAHGLSLPRRNG
jgi:1,2-diacylglycerol 3-beta-glucosyltransferase